MRPWPRNSLLGPVMRLHLALIMLGCLVTSLCSQPRGPSDAAAARVDYVKSLACRDATTGLEFTPLGIAFDIVDDLYVVDSDHSRIYTSGESISSLTVHSECPPEYPQCEFIDLAINEAGGLYASERSSGLILALDRWGELAAFVETGEGIAGISSGTGGRVFAAHGIAGSVMMADFGAQTGVLESPVAYGDGEAYPVDCCLLPGGTVAVTDAFSRRLLLLSPLGKVEGAATGFEFERPFGVTSLGDNMIMVSDSDRGLVAVFDAHHDFLFSFGEGILDTPTFLACRADGLVCISDAGSMTIEVFRLEVPSDE